MRAFGGALASRAEAVFEERLVELPSAEEREDGRPQKLAAES